MKRIILVLVLSLIAINIKAQDLRTYPVLWHQTSAEYRALYYQAFNSGRTYLETLLKTRQSNEKFAVEFLQWAAKHNITIFYISNRTSANIKPKLVNLKNLGDNLNDFTSLFENKNIADRKAEVDKVRDESYSGAEGC